MSKKNKPSHKPTNSAATAATTSNPATLVTTVAPVTTTTNLVEPTSSAAATSSTNASNAAFNALDPQVLSILAALLSHAQNGTNLPLASASAIPADTKTSAERELKSETESAATSSLPNLGAQSGVTARNAPKVRKLFSVPAITNVPCCKKPVRKALATDRQIFTIEQFVRDKTSMDMWFDGMAIDENVLHYLKTPINRNQLYCYDAGISFPSLRKRFVEAPKHMVMYESNPRVGLGVALDLNSQGISFAETVDIYSACIVDRGLFELRYYSIAWNLEEPYQEDVPNLGTKLISLDAVKVGSFARFFQDAPTEAQLAKVTNISEAVKARIHTATLGINTAVFDGVPFSYLFAMRDIKPGEPLTWCYDETCNWFPGHGLKRYIMDHDGEIVGYLEGNKIIFDYSQRFEEDVNKAIDIMSKVYAKPTDDNRPVNAELDRLKDIMSDKKTTIEDKFIALQAQLNQDGTRDLYNTKLKHLTQKVERLVEEYVAGRKVEGLAVPKPEVLTVATAKAAKYGNS